MAAVVRPQSFLLFVFVFHHISARLINYFMQLALKVESKWICHSCKDSPWTPAEIGGQRLGMGIATATGTRCWTAQRDVATSSLNVASRRWLNTSNCSNQILCSICILCFFFISSFVHYSFLHFSFSLLHFSRSIELLSLSPFPL